jgi:hypothetical protein
MYASSTQDKAEQCLRPPQPVPYTTFFLTSEHNTQSIHACFEELWVTSGPKIHLRLRNHERMHSARPIPFPPPPTVARGETSVSNEQQQPQHLQTNELETTVSSHKSPCIRMNLFCDTPCLQETFGLCELASPFFPGRHTT